MDGLHWRAVPNADDTVPGQVLVTFEQVPLSFQMLVNAATGGPEPDRSDYGGSDVCGERDLYAVSIERVVYGSAGGSTEDRSVGAYQGA